MSNFVVTISANGSTETFDLYDVDGVEWRDMKRATGLSQTQLSAGLDEADFECTAAFLWVVRRRVEPTLAYIEVLRGLSLRTVGNEEEPSSTGPASDTNSAANGLPSPVSTG